jgi:nicotinamide riboside kinase
MTPVLPGGCVIALVGAPGTGKTQLSHALAECLAQRGIAATRVPDGLAEWRAHEAREPGADACTGIAAAQTGRIAEAATRGVVVADTTALIAAVHSDLAHGDASLYHAALEAQRSHAITLLMALDLPRADDEAARDAPASDLRIRCALARVQAPYAVIHGRGAERLASAWNAIQSMAAGTERRSDPAAQGWVWPCEKCSDPGCEHRLFSDLLARRR